MLRMKQGDQVLGVVSEGVTVKLPNGNHVSPALAGWTDGEFSFEEIVEVPVEMTPEEILAEEREGMQLSFPQLIGGLVAMGWISKGEGKAWVRGNLPNQVQALIDSLPEAQQMIAEARAVAPSLVHRTDPLVNGLGALAGKTEEEIDTLFRTFSAV